MSLVLALLLAIATDGASTPEDGYRLLQKAVEKRDAAALAAIIHPDERAWMRRDVARDGIEAVVARIPKGPLTVTYEAPNVYAAKVPSGDAVVFTREHGRWYAGGLFNEKPEPNGPPVTAAKAYEVLRAQARQARPGARLYSLYIPNHIGLNADGTSPHWVAEFLSDTPGEMLTCFYDKGEISGPARFPAPAGREGIPNADGVRYDSKALYEETLRRAKGIVDPIDHINASLTRSARDGQALWMVNVYDADKRIGTTVIFDAQTLKFSHQTR